MRLRTSASAVLGRHARFYFDYSRPTTRITPPENDRAPSSQTAHNYAPKRGTPTSPLAEPPHKPTRWLVETSRWLFGAGRSTPEKRIAEQNVSSRCEATRPFLRHQKAQTKRTRARKSSHSIDHTGLSTKRHRIMPASQIYTQTWEYRY